MRQIRFDVLAHMLKVYSHLVRAHQDELMEFEGEEGGLMSMFESSIASFQDPKA